MRSQDQVTGMSGASERGSIPAKCGLLVNLAKCRPKSEKVEKSWGLEASRCGELTPGCSSSAEARPPFGKGRLLLSVQRSGPAQPLVHGTLMCITESWDTNEKKAPAGQTQARMPGLANGEHGLHFMPHVALLWCSDEGHSLQSHV